MNPITNRGIRPANEYVKNLGVDSTGKEVDGGVFNALVKVLNKELGRIEANQENTASQLNLLESFLFPVILEVSFNPNESKVFSHTLGRIPTQRIILRQTGNGVITDVNADWNKETVGFKNNGSVAVTATIALR